MAFQHTAARRRLVGMVMSPTKPSSFNTQPPEGGWQRAGHEFKRLCRCFNTQPPEGGWQNGMKVSAQREVFQHTAARRRLGGYLTAAYPICQVSTHSRPKAAGRHIAHIVSAAAVSTHSRPKAAGAGNSVQGQQQQKSELKFHHTAARRRLDV